jgi:hypothetical protein
MTEHELYLLKQYNKPNKTGTELRSIACNFLVEAIIKDCSNICKLSFAEIHNYTLTLTKENYFR